MRHRIIQYLSMTKPRIGIMVLVVTAMGFFLGGGSFYPLDVFALTLIGTLLSCAGAATLNHYLERDLDSLMARTRNRPLVTHEISPPSALAFGTMLVLAGVLLLAFFVNLLTAFLALLTAFLYVVVYTPLKRLTWMNTVIGAIPGALPPLGGWAASTGGLDLGAWILFCVLFLWQHPHFFSIAWLYRDDYNRAGYKMLPAIDARGDRTIALTMATAVLLIPISILPFLLGMAGPLYLCGALTFGIVFFGASLFFSVNMNVRSARTLLKVSLIYLPGILGLVILDGTYWRLFSL